MLSSSDRIIIIIIVIIIILMLLHTTPCSVNPGKMRQVEQIETKQRRRKNYGWATARWRCGGPLYYSVVPACEGFTAKGSQ